MVIGPFGYASGLSSRDWGTSKFGSSSTSSIRISAKPLEAGTIGRRGGKRMPSLGPWLGVNSGSDGDDWKWRKVLGRVRDGVAGIASLDGRLPFAGVFMVSPSALGLLLCGGVGGL